MRTFVIRARKAATAWERVRAQVGTKAHFEVIAHCIINAFFLANDFRTDVEVYIILDSSQDFPRTLKLSGADGLSLAGFHEEAVISMVEQALKSSKDLQKNESRALAAGISIHGFGFEKLIAALMLTRTIYLLAPKACDIRAITLAADPVFILSDHLMLPAKNLKSLKNRGLHALSLGKKMLYASQCVVLLNHELDRLVF